MIMNKIFTDELTAIKNAILAAVPAEKIYLFGSRARGTANADSDYDIYIVLPDGSISEADATKNAYLSLVDNTPYPHPIDIIAACKSKFSRRKIAPTLERVIEREGVVLYEKN